MRAKRILYGLESARLGVEIAEIVVYEADEPDLLVHLFAPDPLPGKDLTEIHLPAVVADPSAASHQGGPIV